ncbi:hypothetical protein Trydic_g23739 [Trypoxylus dichotomus]
MEFLESSTFDIAAQKPLCWYWYVEDTFVVWPHGADRLSEVLQHLNSIHPRIQFTVELKKDGQLPFLGVLTVPRRSVNSNTKNANEHQLSRDWQGIAYLPYIKSVMNRIGRTLERHNIKTIYTPTQQLRHKLHSVKDPRDLLTSTGVYRIPCSCGLVYIGTTKRSINTRLKEHKRNCRLGQTEKSVVAEHALQDGDHNFNFAEVLSTVLHYHTWLQREAIEIYKHPGNFNKKEENPAINKIWYLILRNTPVTRTANRANQRRIYNGCMPDSESFDAKPSKRTLRPRR